ncbi:hypothetical protein M413DRAFT_32222 [Hebeloma cylindrosporum]|uniref:F-box domain-containing protein n=1 Tax=Hebeloma cylindrosporum TaxID=76867 RepID=A0A0C2Y3V6_HEBCY|nr:hypothetical protein M413DRAFT_32222 [Hebeloma cylindrosporum h7]
MLPLELLRPIIEQVDDTDAHTICSLLFTCKLFQHEAERRLYHTPNPASPSNLRSPSTHVAFLSTIIKNQRLASLVHTYTLNDVVSYGENPLWDLVKGGLRAMVNLKVLRFRAFAGEPCAEILDGCAFRLERLHWGSHSDEVTMMRSVLPQQPNLRELYIECTSRTVEGYLSDCGAAGTTGEGRNRFQSFFPADGCCPNLHWLGGNRTTMELFLPNRDIRKVSWVPGLDDANDDPLPELVVRALGRVETLSFGGYFTRPPLTSLIDHLRELRVLEIIGLHTIEELQMMPRLPHLRELVISLQWGNMRIPLPDLEDRRRVVGDLFAGCGCLEVVDFVSSWVLVREIWYQRWRRGDLGPRGVLLLNEVREGRF